MTNSDLFRRMVTTYKTEREEEEFVALQRKMDRRTRKTDVLTEEVGERIVFSDLYQDYSWPFIAKLLKRSRAAL